MANPTLIDDTKYVFIVAFVKIYCKEANVLLDTEVVFSIISAERIKRFNLVPKLTKRTISVTDESNTR